MSMIQFYILDAERQIKPVDLETWATWVGNPDNRAVAHDSYRGVTVSTVFIGVDANVNFDPPRLFETMVFGGVLDCEVFRTENWAAANQKHQEVLQVVTNKRGRKRK
jgi:hypothetical protein